MFIGTFLHLLLSETHFDVCPICCDIYNFQLLTRYDFHHPYTYPPLNPTTVTYDLLSLLLM